ncbi:MAG: 1,4-dihydroxy-6-naphthoate synthase [Chitinophagaceae bacterium]
MTLTLGFSPCPNDTFIFDALVNHKIDTEGLQFTAVLEDVQTLNEWAIKGKLDVTKISYGVLPLVLNRYNLMDAGGALGKGVGPLLIAKRNIPSAEIHEASVAIPGRNTTANLLFSLAFPGAVQKKFMLFSEIEHAVLEGIVDAGVIIHENRFTYQDKGLIKLMDLGEFWEQETGSPIPLGGIIMRNEHDTVLQNKVDALIRKSLEFALSQYPFISDYVKQHSQQLDEVVMRQHIDLYVNNYSLGLGEEGRAAIDRLLQVYNDTKQV